MHKLLSTAFAAGLLAGPLTAHADETIDFVIEDGKVIPTEDFAVMVSVLGAAITSGNKDMPVTAEVHIGEEISLSPWGDAESLDGDVNTHGPTRHHIVREQFLAEEGLAITVTARSWLSNGKVHMHDLHATLLYALGLDHERLTYRHAGRDFRLTDVHGNVVHDILA